MERELPRRLPQICDVGPRDGLQNAGRVLDVETKVEFINQLGECGIDRIEAVSFVNPKKVPQMADAAAVLRAIKRVPSVRYTALALNLRGAEMALAEKLDEIRFAVSVSETFNRRNQGVSPAESVAMFRDLVRLSTLPVSVTIICAFGCPFEGEIPVERVAELAGQLAEAGTRELLLADTIGVAVPQDVERLLPAVRKRLDAVDKSIEFGVHFHDTRRTGIANVDAAVRFGVDVIDSSVGGFGGCPFAPGATGNVATEDVGYLFKRSGLPTKVDLDKLAKVAAFVGEALGQKPPGAISNVGPFPRAVAA